jgi:hypothetical protein
MSSADPRLRALLKLAPVIPVYTPEDVNEAVEVAQALFRSVTSIRHWMRSRPWSRPCPMR